MHKLVVTESRLPNIRFVGICYVPPMLKNMRSILVVRKLTELLMFCPLNQWCTRTNYTGHREQDTGTTWRNI